jgi:hypothetical protein
MTAATLLVLGGVIAAAGTAHAYPAEDTCGTSGTGSGYCMNDWNGNSGHVYGYTAGATNENFQARPLYRCGGGTVVTSTCPFSDHSMDSALSGQPIIEIHHITDGLTDVGCVADPSMTGLATIGNCNYGTGGTGGSFASVFVVARNGSLVDVGWTNNHGAWVQINSNGDKAQMSYYDSGNPTIWSLGL